MFFVSLMCMYVYVHTNTYKYVYVDTLLLQTDMLLQSDM